MSQMPSFDPVYGKVMSIEFANNLVARKPFRRATCREGFTCLAKLTSRSMGIILGTSLCGLLLAVSMTFVGQLRGQVIPGPTSVVAKRDGQLSIQLDGIPLGSLPYATYAPNERYFAQFGEAGTNVYSFSVNTGEEPWWHSVPTWVSGGVWNFSEFDEWVHLAIKANPNALFVPRIYIGEPDWWRDLHPDELIVFDDGKERTTRRRHPFRLWPEKESRSYGSIASSIWRQDMANSLRRLLKHIHESEYGDRIIGYQLNGLNTEEWYYFTRGEDPGDQLGDYSRPMREYFREWLKEKYQTDSALQTAWSKSDATFMTVELPTIEERSHRRGKAAFRDPSTYMNVIDFYECYNGLIPDTIDYFARVVKEETQAGKVVGAFYSYLFEFQGRPDTGHNASQKLLASENIDFIAVTASYGNRTLGRGGSILRSPHTSMHLHGKLWHEDNDTVSFLFPEVSRRIGDNEWERSKVVLAATDDAEQSQWIFLRGAGFAIANNVHQTLLDLHGGYFDHPDLMNTVQELNELTERTLQYDRSSCAEILVVADERSTYYPTMKSELMKQALYDPPYSLIKLGAPYDCIYLDDLSIIDMEPYKLVIFLNAYHLTSQQIELIQQTVLTPGRTIFWTYDVGRFSENCDTPETLSILTGMEFERKESQGLIAPRIEIRPNTGFFTDNIIESHSRIIGPNEESCHPVILRDPDAIILGICVDNAEAVLGEKTRDGVRSVYSLTASLPPQFYRELAKSAGVHIYNDQDDTLYVCKDFLAINADGVGVRTLEFPISVNVFDAVSEVKLANAVGTFELPLVDLETRILRIEPAANNQP